MIGRLAIAQLRAYRTQSIWTLSLLTLLVAILTATVVMGATQARLAPDEGAIWGWDKEYQAFPLVEEGDAIGQPDLSMAEVVEAVQTNPGHDAVAVLSGDLTPDPIHDTATDFLQSWSVVSSLGDGASLPLTQGRAATSQGEIVLAADSARELGVQIGDIVTLYQPNWTSAGTQPQIPHRFTLVGVAASTTLPGFDLHLPSAYLSWQEAASPDGPLAYHWAGDDGAQFTSWNVSVAWNGYIPALATIANPSRLQGTESISLPGASIAWFGTAAVLLLAMMVMAFAVGRSQASQRAQWIATVRTMGARRGALAVAALAETLLIASVACVVGTAAGIGLAQGALTWGRLAAREPFGSAWVSLHGLLIPVAAIAALVPALVIATVPAFWASRVEPTAALKPVNELTEAEISRRVPAAWAAVPPLVGAGLVVLGTSTSAAILPVVVLGWICVAVGVVVMVIEAHRGLTVLTGRAMARSSRASVMSAGDELVARPRQSVAPAVLATATATAAAMWTLRQVIYQVSWWYPVHDDVASYTRDFWRSALIASTRPTMLATVMAALMVAQIVAAAIVWSHREAARHDDLARAALGLSRRQLAATWWWVAWVPQFLGAVVGVLLAALIGLVAIMLTDVTPVESGGVSIAGSLVGAVTGAAAAVAAVGLALGAASAWAVSRLTMSPLPAASSVTGPAALTGAAS